MPHRGRRGPGFRLRLDKVRAVLEEMGSTMPAILARPEFLVEFDVTAVVKRA